MSYKTRPYVGGTFGIVPNPMKDFEVTAEELITHKRVLGVIRWASSATMDLAGASADPEQNLFQGWFDIGNVSVSVSGKMEVFRNIRHVPDFVRAIKGTHPSIQSEVQARERFVNLNETDLMPITVYYPHIPKAVDRLLRALGPSKYNAGAYSSRVREGEWVKKSAIIAKYGDIEINAPFDGRIEMIGSSRPGHYQWPDLQKVDDSVRDDDDVWLRNNINRNAIVYSEDVQLRDGYAFGIRPVKDPEYIDERVGYQHFPVRNAFDRGGVWRNMKLKRGRTFYTIIDLAVLGLKTSGGSGIKLPKSLRDDHEYEQELRRYWDLINNGVAMIQCADAGPEQFGRSASPEQTTQSAKADIQANVNSDWVSAGTPNEERSKKDAVDVSELPEALEFFGLASKPSKRGEVDDAYEARTLGLHSNLKPKANRYYDVILNSLESDQ